MITKVKGASKGGSLAKGALIIAAIALFLAIVIFFAGSKIKFIINDELNLIVTPTQSGVRIINNESANAIFFVKNNNFGSCAAECEFSFISLKDNKILFRSNETLKHNQEIKKSFQVEGPGKGEGQALYRFEARCHNIKTMICMTDGENREKSAIFALNYDLKPDEKNIKKYAMPLLQERLDLAAEAQSLLSQNELMIKRLPSKSIEASEIRKEHADSEEKLKAELARNSYLRTRWESEDYFSLKSTLKMPKEEELSSLKQAIFSTNNIKNDTILSIARHNQINIFFKEAEDKKSNLSEVSEFYREERSLDNDRILTELNKAASNITSSYSLLKSQTIYSEEKIILALQQGLAVIDLQIRRYDELKRESDSLAMQFSIMLESHNHSINISSANSTNPCDIIRVLILTVDAANNKSVPMQPEPSLENDSYAKGEESTDNESSDDAANSSATAINTTQLVLFNNKNCGFFGTSSSQNISTEAIDRLLSTDTNSLGLEDLSLEVPDISYAPEILVDNERSCCAHEECHGCCPECDEPYPVLFIHGHTFNSANTPEYSMNAFSKIQSKMAYEGFISLGELDLKNANNETPGMWGEQKSRVCARASYYYITHYSLGSYDVATKKTESIENYAIRLKEIVDLLKQKTGKDKMIIVAHSMGGLVAREYLVLFGDGSVDKLIMINTPNHGVSGKVKKYCSILGSEKECEDMAEDSIFISRLNAKPLPLKEVHNIRSTGCLMDYDKYGDGVVTSESAYYADAKNYEIKGICDDSLGTGLHSDVLDPEKYPELYELLISMIEEN